MKNSVNVLALVIVAAAGSTLAGCGGSPADEGTAPRAPIHVELQHSHEPAGAASLESIGPDQTRVTVELTKPLPRAPAAIHAISCFEKGSRLFPLAPIREGRSRTEINLPLEDLASRDFVVLVADFDGSVACGSFVARAQGPPSPQRAAAIAACYEPENGYGFRPAAACSAIEKLERVRARVWRVQLRRPPVYCVHVHLDASLGSGALDIDSVGVLDEARCPAAAYADEPTHDVRVALRTIADGEPVGFVSLAAVGKDTRVLVEAEADSAWIVHGRCPEGRHRFDLDGFYSFRSVTTLNIALRSLTVTPHAVMVDWGGAHGGEPQACADLSARAS